MTSFTLEPAAQVVPADVPFQVAAVIDVPRGWHVYWENPGQSGLATDVRLAGAPATGPVFALPERFEADGLVSYGYGHRARLVFDVTAPPGPLELVATGSWILCKDVCVRGEGTARLRLEARPGATARRRFDRWLPRAWPDPAGPEVVVTDTTLDVRSPRPVEVFPTVALESAWAPTVVSTAPFHLHATLAAPPPGARLVVVSGRKGWSIPVTQESP